MDFASSLPGSPTPTPLQPVSDERVNQRDSAMFSSLRSAGGGHSRDSSVHDKISQFNTLAMQSKQLERKTADAALKRAMLGREEAESEMRRYRDEARALRRQLDEGKERERRVGERLETVMENYGRAKETHAHTQALWEKEIRRARKETFKSQSVIVKLQEELKSARTTLKSTEENLEREKERSHTREQEAFQARYELVGCQEQLEQALEHKKGLEQERDAFKSLAKSEEDVAKIAGEGLLPLPPAENPDPDDEFASPKKKPRVSSMSLMDVRSSAASEAEIDELTRLWQWEKQRADRAVDEVEYLQLECQLQACSCMRKRPRSNTVHSPRKRPALDIMSDGADAVILSEKTQAPPATKVKANMSPKRLNLEKTRDEEPRRDTIFIPEEGVFRTVSQADAEAAALQLAAEAEAAATAPPPPPPPPAPAASLDSSATEPLTPADPDADLSFFSRTPSVDPPTFAIPAQQRTSLISLLEAPHKTVEPPLNFHVPTIPAQAVEQPPTAESVPAEAALDVVMVESHEASVIVAVESTSSEPQPEPEMASQDDTAQPPPPPPTTADAPAPYDSRPHTVAGFYSTKTTTTKVPLREETTDPSLAKRILESQRTPARGNNAPGSGGGGGSAITPLHGPSFDVNNPALTPTMTREQALAQIRERRGRARSAASGALTPRRKMVEGTERRDISAPVGRVTPARVGSVRRKP